MGAFVADQADEVLHHLHRFARRGRKIDRDQDAPKLDVAVDLADEAARALRHEQRRDRQPAEHHLGHRSSQPALDPVPAVGCKHYEVARLLIQVAQDALRRVLPAHGDAIDYEPELVRNDPGRVVGARKSPLHEQTPHLRKRRRFARIAFRDMQQVQLAPRRQGYTQRVRERGTAQIGKIRRMQDRTNGLRHPAHPRLRRVPVCPYGTAGPDGPCGNLGHHAGAAARNRPFSHRSLEGRSLEQNRFRLSAISLKALFDRLIFSEKSATFRDHRSNGQESGFQGGGQAIRLVAGARFVQARTSELRKFV